jgi:hypothetical protein
MIGADGVTWQGYDVDRAKKRRRNHARGRPATHQVVLRALVKHQVCWLVASAAAPSSTRIPSIEGDVSKAIEAATTILRASVRRHRRAQRHPWLLRSITPTRATTSLAASVDPTDARKTTVRRFGRSDRRAQRAGPPTKLAGGRDRPADRSPAGRLLPGNKKTKMDVSV